MPARALRPIRRWYYRRCEWDSYVYTETNRLVVTAVAGVLALGVVVILVKGLFV